MPSALVLNCTLKPSPAPSSTHELAREVLDALAQNDGVSGEEVRVVDFDVRPGVEKDMGQGDDWPAIRQKVLAADILVLATPTWVGHPSSIAARVLERFDAELSETDAEGRPILFGKVAVVVVVGNEDGAHKITADLFQSLNDVGYTIPAQAAVYWNGEAMQTTNYIELEETPEAVASAAVTAARNAAHLSRLLTRENYPAD
jgi:multimeric flavodoxin WrbA